MAEEAEGEAEALEVLAEEVLASREAVGLASAVAEELSRSSDEYDTPHPPFYLAPKIL